MLYWIVYMRSSSVSRRGIGPPVAQLLAEAERSRTKSALPGLSETTLVSNLAEKLKIQSHNDWYAVLSRKRISDAGGSEVLKKHSGSLASLLNTAIKTPEEHRWHDWLFRASQVPSGYWKAKKNRVAFMEWAANQLHVDSLDHWYSHSKRDLHPLGAQGLLDEYEGSLSDLLLATYPEHAWISWKFTQVPKGYWSKIENKRTFLDHVSAELGVKSLDAWYHVPKKRVTRCGARFLDKVSESIYREMLMSAYPDHEWDPSRFESIAPSSAAATSLYFGSGYLKGFFDVEGKRLGVTDMADWYQLRTSDLSKPLYSVLGKSQAKNRSLFSALQIAYPEHKWLPWLFAYPSSGEWDDIEDQRKFVAWVEHSLRMKSPEDWYSVTLEQLTSAPGGKRLLSKYRGSAFRLVSKIYPQHPWFEWLFRSVPQGFWKKEENIKRYLRWVGSILGLKSLNDWKTVTYSDVKKLRGHSLFRHREHSLHTLLQIVYPDHRWDFAVLDNKLEELHENLSPEPPSKPDL